MKQVLSFSNMVVDNSTAITLPKVSNFYSSICLVGLIDGGIKKVAEVNFYGTGKTNTAVLNLSSPVLGLYGTTIGKAGGYGHNREDAAFNEAVDKIGVKAHRHVTPFEFFEGLARHLGIEVYSIVESKPKDLPCMLLYSY